MNILETIAGAQGGGAVQQLAAQFGLKPEQAQAALAALMPALAAGLQQNLTTEDGHTRLASALARGGHETYLEDPDTLAQPTTTADGNAILGHIFGTKEVSRQVATRASHQTGIDSGILRKMLPLVAALAMGRTLASVEGGRGRRVGRRRPGRDAHTAAGPQPRRLDDR